MAQPVDQPGQARREGNIGFVDFAGTAFLPNQCQQRGRRFLQRSRTDQARRAFQRMRRRSAAFVSLQLGVVWIFSRSNRALEEEFDDLGETFVCRERAPVRYGDVESGDRSRRCRMPVTSCGVVSLAGSWAGGTVLSASDASCSGLPGQQLILRSMA